MSSYLPDNFKPAPGTLNKLRAKGIFEDFLESEVNPRFLTYWQEQKEKKLAAGRKTSWNQTYYNWAIRAHTGRVGKEWEENRHRRESHGRAYKGDLFADVLDKLQGKPKPKKPGIRYHKPEPVNLEGPTMTADEAFEELRRKGIL